MPNRSPTMNSLGRTDGGKRQHIGQGGDGSPPSKVATTSTSGRNLPTERERDSPPAKAHSSSITGPKTPTERVGGKDQATALSPVIGQASSKGATSIQRQPSNIGQSSLTRGHAPSTEAPSLMASGLTPDMTRNFHNYTNLLLDLVSLVRANPEKHEAEVKVKQLEALEKRLQNDGVDIPKSLKRGPLMPASLETRLLQLLKRHFQYDAFRGNQLEIMKSLLCNHDVFVRKPTGGGKSMIYFLPVLLTDKCAIIISPLIALIHDQHEKLKRAKIQTVVLDQTVKEEEKMAVLLKLQQKHDQTKIIILTPEQFTKSRFIDTIIKMRQNQRLAYVAIDEAHFVK